MSRIAHLFFVLLIGIFSIDVGAHYGHDNEPLGDVGKSKKGKKVAMTMESCTQFFMTFSSSPASVRDVCALMMQRLAEEKKSKSVNPERLAEDVQPTTSESNAVQ